MKRFKFFAFLLAVCAAIIAPAGARAAGGGCAAAEVVKTSQPAETAGTSAINAGVPAVAVADSLLTEDAVYRYMFSNFGLACAVMERLRQRELLPAHRLDITEGDLYFNNGYYHHALKHYSAALKHDSVAGNAQAYMEQLHRLISTYDCLHNDARKTEYINLLLLKAKAAGNRAMHAIALFNLGKTIYYQHAKARGYAYMMAAVKEMEATDYKQKYDNLRYNYNTLLVMQQMDKRYDEALATLDALEAVVEREQQGQAAVDGLARKERKALYAHRAVVLNRLHRGEEAEACYRRFIALGDIHHRDNYLIVPYLSDCGRYDEVIRINSAREAFLRQQRDTITYHVSTIKRSRGEAYERQGDFARAARYYRQLATVVDSLKRREQRSAALELAALYDTTEKEARLREQASQLRERNLLLAYAAGLAGLLAVVLGVVVRHARLVRAKNRALVQNIDRQMDYKGKLEKCRKDLQRLQAERSAQIAAELLGMPLPGRDAGAGACVTPPADGNAIGGEDNAPLPGGEATAGEDNAPPAAGAATEEERERAALTKKQEEEARRIFEQMDADLTERQLFLNRSFSREDLMKLAGVGKNRISYVVSVSTGLNVNGYLNGLRLDHALKLMKEFPHYTVESIAQDSGLPNTSTFYRLFRERFSITPTEYRRGLAEMKRAQAAEEED